MRSKWVGERLNSGPDGLPLEITPQEVKSLLLDGAGGKPRLVDVRELSEVQVGRLESALLTPMCDIPAAMPLLKGSEDLATANPL